MPDNMSIVHGSFNLRMYTPTEFITDDVMQI